MQIGSNVIIRDPGSWYIGRKAVVKACETYGEVTVCTVSISSETGNASITTAVRSDRLEAC